MSVKKGLVLIPMTLREANAFVEQNHRHHKPVVGHKFSIGVSDGEKVVGVAIVGRPVGRDLGSNPALHRWNTQRLFNALCGCMEGGPRYGL